MANMPISFDRKLQAIASVADRGSRFPSCTTRHLSSRGYPEQSEIRHLAELAISKSHQGYHIQSEFYTSLAQYHERRESLCVGHSWKRDAWFATLLPAQASATRERF